MKTAIVDRIAAVYVVCPHCAAPVENADGSEMLTDCDFGPGEEIACANCAKRFKFPRDAFYPRGQKAPRR